MLTCPECDAVLDVEESELDEGEELMCDECGMTFVVTQLDPIELELSDDSEGFDDDDEDEFDEDEEDDKLEEEDEEDEDEDWR
jgi:lysine biosynthesis protein LysW